MIKNIPYRIFALSMALLMLFSSASFAIDMHFCQGEFQNLSLIGKAKTCMDTRRGCVHKKSSKQYMSKGKKCCTNKLVIVDDLDEDFTFAYAIELSDIQLVFVEALLYSYSGQELPQVEQSTFLEIVDPISTRDIYALLEAYLI